MVEVFGQPVVASNLDLHVIAAISVEFIPSWIN